ncbi:MAG TPA: OsmC family protein [Burkholderiales bacterium]|nr:OsmC family protein [Burkholderiales bacterium]
MPRKVSVTAGRSKYVQDIAVGPHKLQADEPSDVGGGDAAPTPYELLLAALGACTSITVQMYAERRRWPLEGVHVELSYAKVHADDCANCDTEVRTIEQIEREISLLGDLSEEQRQRLMDIADRCPLHRTLTSQIEIRTRQTAGVKRGV